MDESRRRDSLVSGIYVGIGSRFCFTRSHFLLLSTSSNRRLGSQFRLRLRFRLRRSRRVPSLLPESPFSVSFFLSFFLFFVSNLSLLLRGFCNLVNFSAPAMLRVVLSLFFFWFSSSRSLNGLFIVIFSGSFRISLEFDFVF